MTVDAQSNLALLFEYFPELYKPNLKKTHARQWTCFLEAFSYLCLWIHTSRAKHKNGGIVLFPGWWSKYLLNNHRWHFSVQQELEPYLITDGHYNYKLKISREWFPDNNFINRSKLFISDPRFSVNGYWNSVIKEVIIPDKIEYNITRGYIQLPNIQKLNNTNIESFLITKAYADKLIAGLPITYSIANNGRLHHPLQNLKKEYRNILFSNWYSYDFNACAPSILAQEYFRLVPNGKLPAVQLFIENRNEIREEISKQTGIDSNSVKRALTGLFFGQTVPTEKQAHWDIVTSHSNKFKFSLINTFGPEISEKLLSNELFISIVLECQDKIVKELSNALKQNAIFNQTKKYWEFTNLAGGVKIMSRWNAKQAVAHWYFGAERLAIDVASKIISANDNIQFLLIHDGFIVNKEIDQNLILSKIKEELNFTLQLHKEKIN